MPDLAAAYAAGHHSYSARDLVQMAVALSGDLPDIDRWAQAGSHLNWQCGVSGLFTLINSSKGPVTVTGEVTPRLVSDMRGVRYGEVLVAYIRGSGFEADVFGTQMLNDCPQELWDSLDAAAIAVEMGAEVVKLNGPRYWMLDGLGQKVAVVDPVFRDFNGLTMRRIATVDLGGNPSSQPYVERYVNRGAVFFFDAGSPVYELVNPDGLAYVMQAYCVGVDPTLTEESLPTLGERLALPEDWSYRTRILEQELVVDTTATIATVVQDELENTYTLPG